MTKRKQAEALVDSAWRNAVDSGLVGADCVLADGVTIHGLATHLEACVEGLIDWRTDPRKARVLFAACRKEITDRVYS